MKIIFLDVDGVLNSLESLLALETFVHLDPIRVGMVAKLCKETGAQIVVSSSWRTGNTERTKKVLSDAGATSLAPYIVDETRLSRADSLYRKRGYEIKEWLDKHPEVTSYVILDDNNDMLKGQTFIKTSDVRGFTIEDYLQALAYLQPDHRDLHQRTGLKAAVYPTNIEW